MLSPIVFTESETTNVVHLLEQALILFSNTKCQ